MIKLTKPEQKIAWRQRKHNQKLIQRFQNMYDAAQTTTHNERHWQYASMRNADDVATAFVRDRVAGRARYEYLNNASCRGVVTTLSRDVVSKGPTLQILGNDDLGDALEMDWRDHAERTGLNKKLREAVNGETVDGQLFPTVVFKDHGDDKLVSLDIENRDFTELIEDSDEEARLVDGIQYDANGNPTIYHFKQGPVDASQVSHLYRKDLPRQHQGVSRLSSALETFAIGRRIMIATLNANETAASYGGILKTDIDSADLQEDGEDELVPREDLLELIDLDRNGFMVVPKDWELDQFDAKHPNAQFETFRRSIISESARCLNMPYNIAAADSSRHNYASARLDRQGWQATLDYEEEHLETELLKVYLTNYIREWLLIRGIPSARSRSIRWRWFWSKQPHVDDNKVSTANARNLEFGITSLAEIHGELGKDVETEIEKEAKFFAITPEQFKQLLLVRRFGVNVYQAVFPSKAN